MISYKITSKSRKNSSPSDAVKITKELLFTRSLARWQRVFKKGYPIRINGTNKKGIITKVYTDVSDVVWENNRPHFIEVCMNDGEQYVATPSQLTRKNAT